MRGKMRVKMRSCFAAACLATAAMSAGCSRKSGPRTVVIAINKGSLATVDGAAAPPGDFLALLKERAAAAPKDADGLPVLPVAISADPECRYRHIQDAMMQCVRAYIWRISWEMNGRRLDASVSRDGHHPVYIHEEVAPVFAHEETEAPVTDELAEVPELPEGIPTPTHSPVAAEIDSGTAREAGESGGIRRTVERCGHVRVLRGDEPSPELRVKIVWENGEGQMIYSPASPLPPNSNARAATISTAGAHVVIKVNRDRCADFDDLERKLTALAAGTPEAFIVLDAKGAVPFEQAFRALEVCRRSGVEMVLFQSPPVPGAADDWWWLE